MNNKNYRDIVLTYIDKLGEIDKLEDKLIESEEGKEQLKEQINALKTETNNLKKQIDSHKRKK